MKNITAIFVAILAMAVAVAAVFGYLSFIQPPQAVALSGSGATVPAPLLTAMIDEYHTKKSNIQITYDPVGSSGGINKLVSKTVDFACSDAPLSSQDRANAPNALHIPESIGAVAVAYNLKGISGGLQLSGPVLADIFTGAITRWTDPAITRLNPTVTLPDAPITVVHRSEGSGTTFIFTSYLCEVSTSWERTVGAGKTVTWPVGLSAEGNPGVAGVVQGQQNTIGYIELAYVIENNMTAAAVQNPAGNYVTPSLESTQIAAQSGASSGLPAGNEDWTSISLLNTPDAQAYPLVSFTYTLVYQELNVVPSMTADKASSLVDFLWWMVHDGQNLAPNLEYAKLPSNVVAVNEASIRSITFNGQPVLK
jgi:phosphate ABC transporter phosphate-binding protein